MSLAKDRLKVSLSEAIQKWIDHEAELDDWDQVGLTGDHIADNMATAAFAVLDAGIDLQDYLEDNDMLKE